VGIQTIAAATSEEIETIEDVYEPFFDSTWIFNPHSAWAHGDRAWLRASWLSST